jgi:hypothetical protein
LSSAAVQVKKGTTVFKTVYTAVDGGFMAGSLPPGTYTLTVIRLGYTFANPAATVTIGGSKLTNTITALSGPLAPTTVSAPRSAALARKAARLAARRAARAQK